MSRPDSLMSAARQLADAAGLSRSEVHLVYRALQERGGELNKAWLPKSVGRKIYTAQPVLIARLMFALGDARSEGEAHHAVELALALTPQGRPMHPDEMREGQTLRPLDVEFIHLLTDPEAAAAVDEVEFRSDRGEVVIVGATRRVFSLPKDRGGELVSLADRLIYRRGVIRGAVFERMAKNINWSLPAEKDTAAAE